MKSWSVLAALVAATLFGCSDLAEPEPDPGEPNAIEAEPLAGAPVTAPHDEAPDAAPAPEVDAAPAPEIDAAPAPEIDAAPAPEVDAAPAPEVDAAPCDQP